MKDLHISKAADYMIYHTENRRIRSEEKIKSNHFNTDYRRYAAWRKRIDDVNNIFQ